MHLTFKTILNQIQPINGFVFSDERIRDYRGDGLIIDVTIREHKQREAICPKCEKACPTYDHLSERAWQFVPCWGLAVFLHYAPRRVSCPEHGILVEAMPWSDGKRPYCNAMMQFLGNWARRLSWQETATIFKVSWQAVYRSVDWMVDWGLKHRSLDGITAIGIDEIHVGHGKKSFNYLTVIYEIDAQCRRLLWVGRKRTAATLRKGLAALGKPVLNGIQYVCSDMWMAYLNVVRTRLKHACHMIDRFHIIQHLNEAVDEVRRKDVAAMTARPRAKQKLKKMRWILLSRKTRVLGKAREKLNRLLSGRLQTGKAYILKEAFGHFWDYRSVTWAGAFMRAWIQRAKRSRIVPMIKVANMIEAHEGLILNWIRARREVFTGATEGLNNKARVVTRRSYGFRTFHIMELALYHTLGQLPEPAVTHRFW
jgi:transposase